MVRSNYSHSMNRNDNYDRKYNNNNNNSNYINSKSSNGSSSSRDLSPIPNVLSSSLRNVMARSASYSDSAIDADQSSPEAPRRRGRKLTSQLPPHPKQQRQHNPPNCSNYPFRHHNSPEKSISSLSSSIPVVHHLARRHFPQLDDVDVDDDYYDEEEDYEEEGINCAMNTTSRYGHEESIIHHNRDHLTTGDNGGRGDDRGEPVPHHRGGGVIISTPTDGDVVGNTKAYASEPPIYQSHVVPVPTRLVQSTGTTSNRRRRTGSGVRLHEEFDAEQSHSQSQPQQPPPMVGRRLKPRHRHSNRRSSHAHAHAHAHGNINPPHTIMRPAYPLVNASSSESNSGHEQQQHPFSNVHHHHLHHGNHHSSSSSSSSSKQQYPSQRLSHPLSYSSGGLYPDAPMTSLSSSDRQRHHLYHTHTDHSPSSTSSSSTSATSLPPCIMRTVSDDTYKKAGYYSDTYSSSLVVIQRWWRRLELWRYTYSSNNRSGASFMMFRMLSSMVAATLVVGMVVSSTHTTDFVMTSTSSRISTPHTVPELLQPLPSTVRGGSALGTLPTVVVEASPVPRVVTLAGSASVHAPPLRESSSSSSSKGNGNGNSHNERKVTRRVAAFPAEFSDNTQLYGVLDSADPALSRMERRAPAIEGECVPMADWQTTFHPVCNMMHELDLADPSQEAVLFGTKGYWRHAWRVDKPEDALYSSRKQSDTSGSASASASAHHYVLKTLKYEHDFEDRHFEHDRVDAVAMDMLTASPHVMDIYGFCGHSVATEYADGVSVGKLADSTRKIDKSPNAELLKLAVDIAAGLADVHAMGRSTSPLGSERSDIPAFVHLDINPANVMSIGGTLKYNDFNIGILRKWNTTSNQPCGFPAQYPNPQWRSPEEANESQHLDEKVDIFSMGHIFFRLICGHEPWNKMEIGGKPPKEVVNEKVRKGIQPFIPATVLNSTDPAIVSIREAMFQCYSFDPADRPSAKDIHASLVADLEQIQQRQPMPVKKSPSTSKGHVQGHHTSTKSRIATTTTKHGSAKRKKRQRI